MIAGVSGGRSVPADPAGSLSHPHPPPSSGPSIKRAEHPPQTVGGSGAGPIPPRPVVSTPLVGDSGRETRRENWMAKRAQAGLRFQRRGGPASVGRSSCGKGRSLAVGRLERGGGRRAEPFTPPTPRKNSPPPKEGYLPHPPPERLQKDARSQRLRIIPVTFMHPPARHSSRLGQLLQVALGAAAALAAISLSPGSAQALVVTVGGV